MSLHVFVVYNEPTLGADNPDQASEAGVLDSVTAVRNALSAAGHQVRLLPVRSLENLLDDLRSQATIDVIFNFFEGFNGSGDGEAVVAAALETLGHPFTGCDSICLALTRDKARTKWLLRGAGLPTPDFVLVDQNEEFPEYELRQLLALGPAIVKPAFEDASLGIGLQSIVSDFAPLVAQVEFVRANYGSVLVERFIAGREFTAAVVNFGEPRMLPLSEIEFDIRLSDEQRIVGYQAKWSEGSLEDLATVPCCPAQVADSLADRIKQIAIAAFRVSGCRDYARVDLRVDANEQVWILEVNANPDLGPQAGFARALKAAGITYQDFVDRLVRQAAWRKMLGVALR